MVLEARRLVDGQQDNDNLPVQALNALGYDEAAQCVYGMTYGEWKKRHQKKATDEQMEKYNASEPLQAKHDSQLLQPRGEKPLPCRTFSMTTTEPTHHVSNVCCEDVELVFKKESAEKMVPPDEPSSIMSKPYKPPKPPILLQPVRIAILTVSDRAFKNDYEEGDLSGPAVADAIRAITKECTITKAIVPDDKDAIQAQLRQWSDAYAGIDLILTTGGTGFAHRDVTPEATREMLDTECPGLMGFVTTECSHLQPLASLTRGTVGVRNNTMIANLPGNPKGVAEVMPILFPLLLHAVADLQEVQVEDSGHDSFRIIL
jgi:molybdopterin adenylyltransferase